MMYFFSVYQSPVLFYREVQLPAFALPVGSVFFHPTLRSFRAMMNCSVFEYGELLLPMEIEEFMNLGVRNEFLGLFQVFYIILIHFSRQPIIAGSGQSTLQRARLLVNIPKSSSNNIITSFNFGDSSNG